MIDAAADTAVDVLVVAVAIIAVIFAMAMIFRFIGATLMFIAELLGAGKDE